MAFHRAGRKRVNVFPVDDQYLFKHYFDEDEIFAKLQRYYDEYEYRFEVPVDRFAHISDFLTEHGYAPVVVEAVEPFVVVKRKYTEHPEVLFRGSVLHRSVGNFNCFLMKDRHSVTRAVSAGADRLGDTDVAFSLP